MKYNIYGNNMDLDLFYRSEVWCESSQNDFNNVEVIEYVVDTAGGVRCRPHANLNTRTYGQISRLVY